MMPLIGLFGRLGAHQANRFTRDEALYMRDGRARGRRFRLMDHRLWDPYVPGPTIWD